MSLFMRMVLVFSALLNSQLVIKGQEESRFNDRENSFIILKFDEEDLSFIE